MSSSRLSVASRDSRCASSRVCKTRDTNERMKIMSDKAGVRTLRTFQVFRAAYEFHTGEQRYTARQQHREATQVHVTLATGLRRRGVPAVTQIPLSQSRIFKDAHSISYDAISRLATTRSSHRHVESSLDQFAKITNSWHR